MSRYTAIARTAISTLSGLSGAIPASARSFRACAFISGALP